MTGLADSFDEVVDMGRWEEIVVILAAFLAPTVLRNVLEGMTPFDVPDEGYGILMMLIGGYAGAYSGPVRIGGGLYVADKLAERADLKQTVTSLGQGGS